MNATALLAVLTPEREAFVRLARSRVGTEADAEDAVQRAMTRAALHAATLEDPARARAWFYRILRNAIVDHHRARTRDPLREPAPLDASIPVGGDRADAVEATCTCGMRLLAAMRPAYAEAIQRVDLDGEDPRALAHALGISPGNLHVRLHRARRLLRERLQGHCGVTSSGPCLDCTCDGRRRCSDEG